MNFPKPCERIPEGFLDSKTAYVVERAAVADPFDGVFLGRKPDCIWWDRLQALHGRIVQEVVVEDETGNTLELSLRRRYLLNWKPRYQHDVHVREILDAREECEISCVLQ